MKQKILKKLLLTLTAKAMRVKPPIPIAVPVRALAWHSLRL